MELTDCLGPASIMGLPMVDALDYREKDVLYRWRWQFSRTGGNLILQNMLGQ